MMLIPVKLSVGLSVMLILMLILVVPVVLGGWVVSLALRVRFAVGQLLPSLAPANFLSQPGGESVSSFSLLAKKIECRQRRCTSAKYLVTLLVFYFRWLTLLVYCS